MKNLIQDIVVFAVIAAVFIACSLKFMQISYERGLKNGSRKANSEWIRELDKRKIVTAQKGGSFKWRQK